MARITQDDCLQHEINRFSLVLLTIFRTRQLIKGAEPLTDTRGNKLVVTALREIAGGHVTYREN